MPKRRAFGSPAGRIALLHALAHIELNAIDLGWDIIARFSGEALPRHFFDDWVGVASDEAEHFELLARRLRELGARYGDLPAHDGLWESAIATADDLLARLAVVPLVLEARGSTSHPRSRLGSTGPEIRKAPSCCSASTGMRSVTWRPACAGSTGSAMPAGWSPNKFSATVSGVALRVI